MHRVIDLLVVPLVDKLFEFTIRNERQSKSADRQHANRNDKFGQRMISNRQHVHLLVSGRSRFVTQRSRTATVVVSSISRNICYSITDYTRLEMPKMTASYRNKTPTRFEAAVGLQLPRIILSGTRSYGTNS